MKKTISVLILLTSLTVNASSQSIHFEELTWQQALAKAKQQNKMIFVELYTTWCTYCRQMEQSTFLTNETGSYYNEHFINVKYDAQKGDGIQIRKSYTLLGFPTFLYLDANGVAIIKTTGYQNKEKFIQNGDSAFVLHQNKKQ